MVHRAIADALAGAARPLVLSGDCPAGLAVTAVLQRRHPEIGVVWLDAHGDFNTPAITISGYLGGMPVAMLTGRAPELFAEPLGLRPVPEHNIVLAGGRDLDPAERNALAASQVRHIPATADAFGAALSGLRDLPVCVDVVAACLACAWLPGQVGRPPAREAIARQAVAGMTAGVESYASRL